MPTRLDHPLGPIDNRRQSKQGRRLSHSLVVVAVFHPGPCRGERARGRLLPREPLGPRVKTRKAPPPRLLPGRFQTFATSSGSSEMCQYRSPEPITRGTPFGGLGKTRRLLSDSSIAGHAYGRSRPATRLRSWFLWSFAERSPAAIVRLRMASAERRTSSLSTRISGVGSVPSGHRTP